ncbi:unnamed protein product, partial [Mesorhabditis belari]|uniref:Kinesin-associated protein 3 n=1 Tax=Mesorhabditis belari TaxID=2138241 RepID=A0AAF3EAN3_9BILA
MARESTSVYIDAHPIEQAIIVRFQSINDGNSSSFAGKTYQKIIVIRELSSVIDVKLVANEVMAQCGEIPEKARADLEHTIHYLQKRKTDGLRSRGSSTSLSDQGSANSIKANMEKIEDYIELFYEEISEKTRGTALILELASDPNNLQELAANESLIGALVRIFREDWKKNFDLATNIIRFFVHLSYYESFHSTITEHKMGALCMTAIEHEIKRGELWTTEALRDDQSAKKYRVALRKQNVLLAACITLLTNLADDLSVEQKMVKRDILNYLLKCLDSKDSPQLILATLQFILKLSIFIENKAALEQDAIIDKLIGLVTLDDEKIQKQAMGILFNLSFEEKNRIRMVQAGLVTHIAPLIQKTKALHLLYQLTINDDAKAMMTYTDAIQILMSDLLSGQASDVGKAVLINLCVEKRNAQLVCGPRGQGLDLLIEQAHQGRDLLIAKIIRNISFHTGPTQELFLKWIPKLIIVMKSDGLSVEENKSAFSLEAAGTIATNTAADWASLCEAYKLVPWMTEVLGKQGGERQPLQLQLVILCGSMATQLSAARLLVPLLDTFLKLLHVMQEDDEFVVQLLYLFLQLIRHKELSDRLMGSNSILGDYVIDLMHDKNESIREMCETALVIIGEHSIEWARRIATQRFRWHNAQWLETVESGGINEISDDRLDEEDEEWRKQVIFDDQLIDDDDLQERLF